MMSLALLALGTAASYLQLTRFLRQDLTTMVAAQQSTLASYVARGIDDSLARRLHMLRGLATSLPRELLTRPDDLQAWLKERHALQPYFSRGLVVVDREGQVVGLPRPVARSFAADPEFLAALGGAEVIGSPRRCETSGRSLLSMAVPLPGAAGQPGAVLVGLEEISPQGFLAQVLQEHTGQGGGLLLISPRDKVFVASTQPDTLLRPTLRPGVDLLHDRAMAGYRGSGISVNAEGVEEISAIASVPLTGWFVVARLPTSEGFAPVARLQAFILTQRLPAVAVLLVIIACTFAWLLRPLFSAAAQAERMTRGDLELAPLPVVRDDEVGHLTASFNRLLAKLGDKQAELERLAHHDSLTGLPNRKLLLDRLQQGLARAQRHGSSVALLFMDLNGFKRLNDTLGHEAGDTALKAVAHRLAGVVRLTDTVARLGGDEFVLLAPDLDGDADNAVQCLVRKCQAAVAQPLWMGGAEHVLGVSIGTAISHGEHSPASLLVAADRAMYGDKLNGRDGTLAAGARAAPEARAPSRIPTGATTC
ncbi:MAG: diguanylate cyclase [Chitinophagaceae bacterium]|nr:diguanylate cyclase [Rubrivivax sp.]